MCSDHANCVLITSDNKFAIVLFTYSIGIFSLAEKKRIHKITGTGREGIIGEIWIIIY